MSDKPIAKAPGKATRGNLKPGFKKGQSGNPAGRKPGQRNKATLLALALMEGELDAIVRSVIEAAKGGDLTASRLIVDKLIPAAKSRPVTINLPMLDTIESCRAAQAAIIASVASGDMLPDDGEAMSVLVENQRRGLESEHILERIAALEERFEKEGR